MFLLFKFWMRDFWQVISSQGSGHSRPARIGTHWTQGGDEPTRRSQFPPQEWVGSVQRMRRKGLSGVTGWQKCRQSCFWRCLRAPSPLAWPPAGTCVLASSEVKEAGMGCRNPDSGLLMSCPQGPWTPRDLNLPGLCPAHPGRRVMYRSS